MADSYRDKPMTQWTPEQISEYVDSHVIMALEAADTLHGFDRQQGEDYVRNRVVAISDTHTSTASLSDERRRRTAARLGVALGVDMAKLGKALADKGVDDRA